MRAALKVVGVCFLSHFSLIFHILFINPTNNVKYGSKMVSITLIGAENRFGRVGKVKTGKNGNLSRIRRGSCRSRRRAAQVEPSRRAACAAGRATSCSASGRDAGRRSTRGSSAAYGLACWASVRRRVWMQGGLVGPLGLGSGPWLTG